jgi:hypothetical protein
VTTKLFKDASSCPLDVKVSPTKEIFVLFGMGGKISKFNQNFEQKHPPVITIKTAKFAFTPVGRIVTEHDGTFRIFE